MNLKTIYLKTADFIEQHPELYNFMKTYVPKCGSPGCILGLMGMIAGKYEEGQCIYTVGKDLFNHSSNHEFYVLMDKNTTFIDKFQLKSWQVNPFIAARCLRKLASKVEEKPLPDWQAISQQPLLEDTRFIWQEPVYEIS